MWWWKSKAEAEERYQQSLELLRHGEGTSDALMQALLTAGKHYDEKKFVQAKDTIAKYLDHPDAQVRHEAMMHLGLWWQCHEFEEKFKNTLMNDPDEDNRDTAADCLRVIKKGTKDGSTLRLLAGVALDAKEQSSVRASAYGAVLAITDAARSDEARRLPTRIEEIKNIDWDWLRSLAK